MIGAGLVKLRGAVYALCQHEASVRAGVRAGARVYLRVRPRVER